MRRSAVSIPSNIAEGYQRQHQKEFRQFLYHALGSLSELETQLSIVEEVHRIQVSEDMLRQIDLLGKKIKTLIKLAAKDSTRQQKTSSQRPVQDE